jgi:hypothetical protein
MSEGDGADGDVITLTRSELRDLIRDVLEEEQHRNAEIVGKSIHAALTQTFASVGITSLSDRERDELKADFSHLRRWRKSVEQAQSTTMRAAIVVLVSGLGGAIWLGIKTLLGRELPMQ